MIDIGMEARENKESFFIYLFIIMYKKYNNNNKQRFNVTRRTT